MMIIKYRVYDNLNKNWVSNILLCPDGKLLYCDTKIEAYLDQSCFTVQMWTGLQDKNGKDIYEGDILNANWTGKYEDEYSIVKYTEAYSGLQFCEIDKDGNLFDFYGGISHEYKIVVGNIFENPKLLEK